MCDIKSAELLRLFKVTFDVSLDVVRFYTNTKIIEPKFKTIDKFLDIYKHIFYHKHKPFVKCCHCVAYEEIKSSRNEMQKWMFDKLYETQTGIPCIVAQTNGTKIAFCLCCVRVKTTLSLDDLDISVISFLLRHTNMRNSYVEDINGQRGLICHACSTKSFKRDEYEQIWNILEQSTLALAQDVNSSYFKTVNSNLKMLKKCDIDKEEINDLLNSITQIEENVTEIKVMVSNFHSSFTTAVKEEANEIKDKISEGTSSVIKRQKKLKQSVGKLGNKTTEEHQKIMNYVQTGQANVSSIIGKESHDIKNLITTTETTVEKQMKDNAQEIKKEINKSTKEGGEYLTNVVSTSENRVCNMIQTGKEETMTHVTCVKDEMVKERKKVSKKVDGMSREIKSLKREMKEIKIIALGKCTVKCNNFKSEVKISERLQSDDRKEMSENRKFDIEAKVISDDLNEEKVVQGLTENIAKEETKETNTQKFHIYSVKQGCIELILSAYPGVFESPDSLRSAVRDLIHQLQETGEVDTNKPGTIYIDITVNSRLTKEEHDVVLKVFAEPCSNEEHFDTDEVKLKQGDAHEVMDVDTTDFRRKAIKQEMLERTENISITVDNIQFNLTFKGLPYDFENDDTTSLNEETDYSFLGWTWDCPKHWDLTKIVSVINDTLSGTSDWFQIDFVHIGASGKLEMQTGTQEHVFNSLLGLKLAVDAFLGKIVDACNLKPNFSESVSINVVYLSGIMRDIEELKDEHRLTSVDTKADDKKSIMVKCQSCGDKFVCENCETYLNTILRQSRMIKNSDNDAEKEWETSNADCQAVTHDDMDVNITDVLGKMVKKEAVQTYEDFEIAVGGIKFSVTFKGLPHSLKTTNDDDTVPNEKTDYCFLGWTWVCPKQWNLPKMVSVLNTELLDSSDWFQIHFAYVGVNGQLEIQTRTQEHVFRQRLGLESAVLRFLGKIVEACDLEQSYSEEVSVSVVFHSGTIEVSDLDKMKYEHVSTSFGKKEMTFSTLQCKSCGDRFPCENYKNYVDTIHQLLKILKVKEYEIERLTFGEQPEKAIEKRKGLTPKLQDNDEQKDSDNDEEKEWETSSVDCQEPELKKRKTYQEDLTGDHQSEKVTTDLTSTGDSEISFDINETLKKLGKLKLIDLKINEGEEQKRKLRPRHQVPLYHFIFHEGSMWLQHVSDLLDDLKTLRKYRLSVSDNLLQEFSYQRKQNAAGTEDLDFLDKNFGLQCNFCLTQNEDDIPGRCKTCSEILCNKCLVQHHVDHSDHSYNYADDIIHGYEKTTYSFFVENALVDIKCLTIDTLVIVHMNRFLGPLKLSIYDLTGNHLTTKQASYGGISDAKIAVIDPTTVAVSIPSDAVLIANYINPIINTKEIKTSPGMTGGIASIKNKLYLAYKTEIKVFTLAGEEITSIDIPDITLLYTVSNYRLLCVCNRKCGQSKTMGYIDIMNNSLLPLDKLPFHPDDVAVDNEGNILFVKDNVVWQAKSDGSDCKVIISENWEHYKRVCFNAYSNLLVVGGSYRGTWVFRKLGDE